ncbi:hypothetical protein ACIA8O_34780 [Kitasatospora sp. NPDC051853]|uniref:hypothetical protein n=1 Tax=Kitasatospora sp. NPDC051853 TaxID=3364058 RepID=UPI00379DF674
MGLARPAGPFGLVAALALAASVTTLPATADDRPRLELSGPSAVAVEPGASAGLPLQVRRPGTEAARDVVVGFDTRDLAGTAELSLRGCTVSGTVHTCTQRSATELADLPGAPAVTVPKSAVPGSRGTLHITATSPGAAPATLDLEVYAGGPRLTVRQLPKAQHVRPGSTLDAVLEVTNSGSLPARRLVVVMQTDETLGLDQRFGNCEYGTRARGPEGGGSRPATTAVVCTVDSAVAPGETVRLDPVRVGVTPAAYYGFVTFSVLANLETGTQGVRRGHEFTPGAGPRLTTGKPESPVAEPGGPGLESPPGQGGTTELEVFAENSADFEAVGRWSPGGDGRTGTLTVGLHNNGPASIADRTGGDAMPTVEFTLPPGARATAVPAGCHPGDDGRGYSCRHDVWAPNGLRADYDFPLELSDPARDARFGVSLQNFISHSEPGRASAAMSWDRNAANDLVEVRLSGPATSAPPAQAPPPATSPAAQGSPTTAQPVPAAATTGTGTTAPGQAPPSSAAPAALPAPLASTGGGASAGPTAAAGGAALTLGLVLMVVVARRRRTGAHRRRRV